MGKAVVAFIHCPAVMAFSKVSFSFNASLYSISFCIHLVTKYYSSQDAHDYFGKTLG